MSWLFVILCGIVCALAGGASGVYIGTEYHRWYGFDDWHGAELQAMARFGMAGAAGGLFLGLASGFLVPGGFWRKLALALSLVMLAAWGWWRNTGRESAPVMGGEELNLLVELRSPLEWKPSNRARAGEGRVTLEALRSAYFRKPVRWTSVDWQTTRVEAGQTIVPAVIPLFSASAERRITFDFGSGTAVSFLVALAARPGEAEVAWGPWLPDPAAGGFQYRVRVERRSETENTRFGGQNARLAELRNAFLALGAKAPIPAYLDFYRNDYQREFELTLSPAAHLVLHPRAEELGGFLDSPAYSRWALFTAVAMKGPLPESYEGPLRRCLPLLTAEVRRFRAGAPADPDLVLAREIDGHFTLWVAAWKRLQEQRPTPWPEGLAEIRTALAGVQGSEELAGVEKRVGELLAGK